MKQILHFHTIGGNRIYNFDGNFIFTTQRNSAISNTLSSASVVVVFTQYFAHFQRFPISLVWTFLFSGSTKFLVTDCQVSVAGFFQTVIAHPFIRYDNLPSLNMVLDDSPTK
ncbi:hypothetical protein RF11_11524 [Thelohanellus kitauei]|uniref:Uncharacterized protein n=1 Tax=Thelohanellus kitauei TaxID=669202 RepID=A0A0C2JPW7_THEKT|nr:hypothetical protein RF11_11524 [Thelohanellus kitauei]